MQKRIASIDHEDRLGFADAVSALVDLYASPLVILHKVLDLMVIHLACSPAFRVRSARSRGAVDSMEIPPEAKPLGTPWNLTSDLSLQLYDVPGNVTDIDFEDVELTLSALCASLQDPFLSERMKGLLEEGFAQSVHQADGERAAALEAACRTCSPAPKDRLTVFLNEAVSLICSGDHALKLRVTGQLGREVTAPRVLLYHRQAEPGRPVGAYLHLAENQRDLVSALLAGEALPETFRTDLDARSPHIAEAGSVAETLDFGVTRWVSWREWRVGHLAAYEAVPTPADPTSDGLDGAVLLIPIHVGGLPWLTLGLLFDRGPQEANRRWACHFYRDLLPPLTANLRQRAESAYFRALRDVVGELLPDEGRDLGQANETLAGLTELFPYPAVELRSEGSDIRWIDRLVGLGQSANQRLGGKSRTADYRSIALTDLTDQFKLALAERAAIESKSLLDRMGSYVSVGHTLKNVVDATGWQVAAAAVAQVRVNAEYMGLDALAERERNKILRALDAANASLNLFSVVGGLGHFIRLAGAQSGQFDWKKFRDWIETEAPPAGQDRQAQLQAYATSLSAMLRPICFGCGWRTLQVDVPDLGLSEAWDGVEPPPLDMSSLHFPPFRSGSDAGFIYLFCLVEPILNGIRALTASGFPRLDRPAPLRIEVRQPKCSASQGVRVEVTNFSQRALNDTLSGWETTKNMMRNIGMGRFDEAPQSELLHADLYRITIGVEFDPTALVANIRRG